MAILFDTNIGQEGLPAILCDGNLPVKLKDLQRVKIFVIEDEAPADPARVRQMRAAPDD